MMATRVAHSPSIGIIGSGHTALAAAKVLIDRGCRPTIVDVGRTLQPDRQEIVDRLGRQPPHYWAASDLVEVTRNPTVFGRKPLRLGFGSDYIYGGCDDESPLTVSEAGPKPTYARGGYSTVWGAAMLPAQDCDLSGWPIGRKELAPYYERVLRSIPFSAREDELAREFPLYAPPTGSIELSPLSAAFLRSLSRSRSVRDRPDVVFGQARLAVRPSKDEHGEGCVYCGRCLSGCVYGAIQSAGDELTRLERDGQVEYRPGWMVRSLDERDGGVDVRCRRTDGGAETIRFDRVFLAAGAINSTRIVLESKRLFDRRVVMKSIQGFVLPMLRLRGARFSWPNTNTLTQVFFEFKIPGVSDHWVHCQISGANELVMARFDFQPGRRSLRDRLLMPGFKRLLVALCNFHSDHAGGHVLSLHAGPGGGPSILEIEPLPSETFARVAHAGAKQLSRLLIRVGVIPLLPLISASYERPMGWHFGATLPMSPSPRGDLETDLLGRPRGWSRVHVVDSSVFPSIPSTTVALLAMANAQRIADSAELHARELPGSGSAEPLTIDCSP